MNPKSQPLFIVLEGIDGCGKSTLAKDIALSLDSSAPISIVNPFGATELSSELRALFLKKRQEVVSPITELYIALAAITDMSVNCVAKNNGILISERYFMSIMAYQGQYPMIGIHKPWHLYRQFFPEIIPHLTIYIDIDPHVAFERRKKRANLSLAPVDDRIESDTSRLIGCRNAYLKAFDFLSAQGHPILMVSGDRPYSDVLAETLELIKKHTLLKK